MDYKFDPIIDLLSSVSIDPPTNQAMHCQQVSTHQESPSNCDISNLHDTYMEILQTCQPFYDGIDSNNVNSFNLPPRVEDGLDAMPSHNHEHLHLEHRVTPSPMEESSRHHFHSIRR